MVALWLAALCPFTANYVAMPLTETPSIFCVALGLCAFAAVLERPNWVWMLALAFRLELCRAVASRWRPARGRLLSRTDLLWPNLAWAGGGAPYRIVLRLWWPYCRSAHGLSGIGARSTSSSRWRPVPPRIPVNPRALGFQRWTKTWMADFASTYEIYWNVPGDDIDIHTLPARALD